MTGVVFSRKRCLRRRERLYAGWQGRGHESDRAEGFGRAKLLRFTMWRPLFDYENFGQALVRYLPSTTIKCPTRLLSSCGEAMNAQLHYLEQTS